jgi:hypothetical protein
MYFDRTLCQKEVGDLAITKRRKHVIDAPSSDRTMPCALGGTRASRRSRLTIYTQPTISLFTDLDIVCSMSRKRNC